MVALMGDDDGAVVVRACFATTRFAEPDFAVLREPSLLCLGQTEPRAVSLRVGTMSRRVHRGSRQQQQDSRDPESELDSCCRHVGRPGASERSIPVLIAARSRKA